MDCTHEFIGNANGVKCLKCGMELTQKEFIEYLNPKPKKTTKKKDVKAAE